MRWTAALGALLTFAVAVLGARATHACEFVGPLPFELDPVEEELDHTPPGAVQAIHVTVKRGFPRGPIDADTVISTCSIRGRVKLHFEAPTDDRTPAELMGYEIAVIARSAPPELIPSRVVRAPEDPLGWKWLDDLTYPLEFTIPLSWPDDGREPLEFTLSIVPIDLAGQRGPANVVEVRHPGSSSRNRHRRSVH